MTAKILKFKKANMFNCCVCGKELEKTENSMGGSHFLFHVFEGTGEIVCRECAFWGVQEYERYQILGFT
jgi:hypothetical protein